ncbi:MAG: EamA family transporter [Chloroflexota bacterium]|nr:EamA family transporter [Chloroflexota bacterium]
MVDGIRTFAVLLVAIALSVTGETLLKKGLGHLGPLEFGPATLLPSFLRIFTTPLILSGFAAIFGGALFWLVVLSKWDLSLAYPLLSISYIASLFVGALFLGENITPLRIMGVGVVVIGVVLLTWRG